MTNLLTAQLLLQNLTTNLSCCQLYHSETWKLGAQWQLQSHEVCTASTVSSEACTQTMHYKIIQTPEVQIQLLTKGLYQSCTKFHEAVARSGQAFTLFKAAARGLYGSSTSRSWKALVSSRSLSPAKINSLNSW